MTREDIEEAQDMHAANLQAREEELYRQMDELAEARAVAERLAERLREEDAAAEAKGWGSFYWAGRQREALLGHLASVSHKVGRLEQELGA